MTFTNENVLDSASPRWKFRASKHHVRKLDSFFSWRRHLIQMGSRNSGGR